MDGPFDSRDARPHHFEFRKGRRKTDSFRRKEMLTFHGKTDKFGWKANNQKPCHYLGYGAALVVPDAAPDYARSDAYLV